MTREDKSMRPRVRPQREPAIPSWASGFQDKQTRENCNLFVETLQSLVQIEVQWAISAKQEI